MEIITSRENARVVQYVRLRDNRSHRLQEGAFVTEGAKLTQEALRSDCRLVQLYGTVEGIARWGNFGRTVVTVSDAVGKKLQSGQSSQGIFAVFSLPDPPQMQIHPKGRYLVLWQMQDPGNLGTVVRSAGAFGLDGVLLTGECADLWSLKTLRASMGSIFRVPVWQTSGLEDAVSQLRRAGVTVSAAVLTETAQVLSPGMLAGGGQAVLIGNEGNGLPDWGTALCDRSITLPMHRDVESLNAAAAAAVIAWEMCR